MGDLLGAMAKKMVHKYSSHGEAYKAVKEAIFSTMGIRLAGSKPVDAIPQLMADPEFRYYPEIKKGHDLIPLPAGAVVVWGATENDPEGHISIALGDGTEASDHMKPQLTSRHGRVNISVFMPV